VTSIPFEKSVFDEVNQLLPKGTDISDEINAFLRDRLKELKEEKNLTAARSNRSAIKLSHEARTSNNYKQQTILSYTEKDLEELSKESDHEFLKVGNHILNLSIARANIDKKRRIKKW
jgi:hypothetical protein